ncbi:omega-hydroxyceramide transacylase-like [Alligator mississippiensis]|uniref:omega-hydroxyceramide transacylase-like n=1 Tax=Alligator mississippiensis TaxID=8496 RepID=UPI0028778AEF|nr:omega-hydroxyceramide transacylase-like [Alligator mississippiensis]
MAEESPKHKPLSLFFKGCGFLIVYELGVVKALWELAPEILRSATKIYGSSSGSIVASIVTCGCELDAVFEDCCTIVKEVRNVMLGPISPNVDLLLKLQKLLYKALPDNAHQLASGRLHVLLTRVSDRQSVVVSDFGSKEEVIQAVICSCFIPAYTGYIPPSFQGVHYIDGNFSSPEPSFYTKTMIIVSALAFDNDICPRDKPGTFFSFYSFQQQFQIQLENLHRVVCCFFPPSYPVSSHQESMQPQTYLLLCAWNKHCLQA